MMISLNRLYQFAKRAGKNLLAKNSAGSHREKKPDPAVRLKQFGVSGWELKRLKQLPTHYSTVTGLLGRKLSITSPFWYLHGLQELFVDDNYQFTTTKADPVIIDCGANIGLSVIYFKNLFPMARVTAFEPDREIFRILQQNIAQFNYAGVNLEQKAVWTENTVLQFHSDGAVGGSVSDQSFEKKNKQLVTAARLRDLLNQKIDFLKIDIEGPEDLILADCSDRLYHVENIFIEYHSSHEKPQSLQDILGILSDNGFRYYIKEAWENMHHPFLQKKGLYYDLQLNIFGYRPLPVNEPSH